MSIIAPSILSMDFSDTKKALEDLKQSKAAWMHFDVMDGHFVPNMTFGVDVLKAMKKSCDLVMDVHVMIENPTQYMDVFVDAGADVYTFHFEVFENHQAIIELANKIRAKGCKAGISIKPKTDVKVLEPLLPYFDLVLIMSVEPGFGGQSFDQEALNKISYLKMKIQEKKGTCLIEVDGGINQETAKLCKEAGVDVLVAGSYVFKGNIIDNVESLL